MTPEHDVAIVGCGPVGLTLGILLAQRGRSVVLLERWTEPYGLPRAVHFDHEIGRILQSCGIGDALRTISEPAEVYEWRNAAGTPLLRFGRRGDALSGWPESSMFSQPELEALLEARANELPGLTIRRGCDVTAIDQSDDSVSVRFTHANHDAQTLNPRFVIGCDGANSTVRHLAGLQMTDLGFFYDWLIVDVVLDHERVFDPLNVQICDPARPTTCVSGGPGRRRWEFMCLPHERIEDLNDEAVAWELLEPWDVRPDNARLERHAVYTFQARYADQWRNGRVFIAGDAAHQMPPFAGQGMCAGLRDAANLAWKLDLVLADGAGDELLDSYRTERLPSVRGAIEFSMELGKVICVPDPDEAAARDEAMSAGVTDELTEAPALPGLQDGVIHERSARSGELLLQGTADGHPSDDVNGVGWRLFTRHEDVDIDPSLTAWFESIDGRLINADASLPQHRHWLDDAGLTSVLQRPDFYVYGTATSASEAEELIRHLRTRLTAPEPEPAGVPS